MKKEKKNNDTLSSLYTKACAFITIILVTLVGFIIAPKQVINDNQLYTFSASIAEPSSDNSILFDYKVFGSEKRFNEALEVDIKDVAAQFKDNEDVLMVKIYGETYTVSFLDDYWFVTDPETPELNIEYYVLTNLKFAQMSLPCHTFINLAKQITLKINIIYLILIILVFLAIEAPLSIGVARVIPRIIKSHKEKDKIESIE